MPPLNEEPSADAMEVPFQSGPRVLDETFPPLQPPPHFGQLRHQLLVKEILRAPPVQDVDRIRQVDPLPPQLDSQSAKETARIDLRAEDLVEEKALQADIVQELAVCFERPVEELGPEVKGFVQEGFFEMDETMPQLPPLFL